MARSPTENEYHIEDDDLVTLDQRFVDLNLDSAQNECAGLPPPGSACWNCGSLRHWLKQCPGPIKPELWDRFIRKWERVGPPPRSIPRTVKVQPQTCHLPGPRVHFDPQLAKNSNVQTQRNSSRQPYGDNPRLAKEVSQLSSVQIWPEVKVISPEQQLSSIPQTSLGMDKMPPKATQVHQNQGNS